MDYNKEMEIRREEDEAELIKFLMSLEIEEVKKALLNFYNIGGKAADKKESEK